MTMGHSSTITDASTDPIADEYGTSGTGNQNGEKHPLVEAGKQAGQSVGVLAERATGLGFQQADRAREQAADGLGQVTDSIRRISHDMEGQQPAIATVVTTAADQADKIADYLRTTDARQILSTVEDAARRQPLVFLGGAFVLGIAVSRFIKAAAGPSGSQGVSGVSDVSQPDWQQPDYGQQWASGPDYQPTGHRGTGTDALTRDRIGEDI